MLVKTPVELTLRSSAADPRRLTARLSTLDGVDLSGRRVVLQRRDPAGWTTVHSALTDSRGRLRWTAPRRATTSYRAVFAATPTERADRSGSVRVRR